MGTVHHIRTAEEIASAPGRSRLGNILSRMTSLLPIDLGIKYDLLSKGGKNAAKAIGAVGLVGTVMIGATLATKGVESIGAQERSTLVNSQNKYIDGKHRTISFEIDGGNANLRDKPVVSSEGGGNKEGELRQGDKVSCSIEINTPDGNTWGVVRDEKGNVSFVNINQNDAVKEVPNPEGCPSEVEITTSLDVANRFAIQSPTGTRVPTFAELSRAPR